MLGLISYVAPSQFYFLDDVRRKLAPWPATVAKKKNFLEPPLQFQKLCKFPFFDKILNVE